MEFKLINRVAQSLHDPCLKYHQQFNHALFPEQEVAKDNKTITWSLIFFKKSAILRNIPTNRLQTVKELDCLLYIGVGHLGFAGQSANPLTRQHYPAV
jgi:hypothetical protein